MPIVYNINGLEQDCSISTANAQEILQLGDMVVISKV